MIADTASYCLAALKSLCEYWWLKAGFATLFITANYLTGDNGHALQGLLVLVTADFLTGISASWKEGMEITSQKSYKSAVKNVAYFILIASAHIAGDISKIEALDDVVISFVAVTEFISILENVGRCGYVIPKKLLNKLHKVREGF